MNHKLFKFWMAMKRSTFLLFVSWSLVQSGGMVHAAPVKAEVELDSSFDQEEPSRMSDEQRRQMQMLGISVPTENKGARRIFQRDEDFFYLSHETLALHAGTMLGVLNGSGATTHYLFGVMYGFELPYLKTVEAGADVVSDLGGDLFFLRKWIFFSTQQWRPCLRAGLGLRFNHWQSLGEFLDINRYQLRSGFGIEDSLSRTLSLRVVFDVGVGSTGADIRLKIGVSFPL